MKTIFALVVLACAVSEVTAQPAPTNRPGADREEKLRQALDRAYAQIANTNPLATAPATATNLAPTGPVNGAARYTNASTALPAAPPAPEPTNITPAAAITPATAIVAVPSTTPTNVPSPIVIAAAPAPAPTNAPAAAPAPPTRPIPVAPSAAARAATNQVRPIRPALPGAPAAAAAPPAVAAVPPGPAAAAPSVRPLAAGETLDAVTPKAEGDEEIILTPGMIKFQDADLFQVLEFYQELTGRTVLRPTGLPNNKITIRSQTPLTRKEAVLALDSIFSLNGVTMVPQDKKFVKALLAAEASTAAREFNTVPHAELPNSGSLVTHVIQLKNALPRDVAQALQPFAKLPNSILGLDNSGILILRDYAENVKRMLEILDKIDVAPLQEFEPVVIPIKYALAGDIAQVLSSLTAGGGGATTVGAGRPSTGLSVPGAAGGRGGIGGIGGAGGYPGQQGFNPQGGATTTGVGGAAGTRGGSFQDRLRAAVNRVAAGGDIVVLSNVKIIADERTNSLLIFASKQDIETIKEIIEKLDVVLAQVIIEALIFQINLGDTLDYGVSYLQHKVSESGDTERLGAILNQPPGIPGRPATLGTNLASSGFSYFMRWGNFDMAVNAVATDSRFKVISRPRIQTSHAVEANLFVGETRPYPTGSYFGGGFGGNYSSIQQLQIGVTLSVLPLINPDGLVVMDIRQKVQDTGEDVIIENIGPVPSTIDREANAKVAVRDRETVMLGGFITTSKRKSKTGVPFLKDIPGLGILFRGSTESELRQELMILIRPTVLPTPEDASQIALEEKTKLPGVMSIEREVAKESEKKNQRAAKDLYKREGFSE